MTRRIILFLILTAALALPIAARADYGGQKTTFSVDSDYDLYGRTQVSATLFRITPSLYFYLEDTWWNILAEGQQDEVKVALQSIEEEFENKIYPKLAQVFGSEWKPGIDKDSHLTILVHQMPKEAGAYTNTGDEYSKLQISDSNEREMIYLNSTHLTTPSAKVFLAHEFTHLITFNQKNRILGVSEEVWLNEARAEYSATLLGYDSESNYRGSNLQRRVREFLQNPNDPLTEWKNEKQDYGVVNLFTQYLVDHYGVDILSDSLFSRKTGILAVNEALYQNGFDEDFGQIFTDWTIAVYLNNCQIGGSSEEQPLTQSKYCYLNPNLKNIKVNPNINLLPLSGGSSLAATPSSKNWAGNWFKIIGGEGDLKVEFLGNSEVAFKVPYLAETATGTIKIGWMPLNAFKQGKIVIPHFGSDIRSVLIIPSIQDKVSGFNGQEKSYSFFWSASFQTGLAENQENQTTQTEGIQSLLKQIEFLEQQLTILREQLRNQLTGQSGEESGLRKLQINLKSGDKGEDVKLLQQWLAKDKDVYPEGLATGYFGNLTLAAVIRFQEKYHQEILAPLGLERGTGFVGEKTRVKLNGLYAAP